MPGHRPPGLARSALMSLLGPPSLFSPPLDCVWAQGRRPVAADPWHHGRVDVTCDLLTVFLSPNMETHAVTKAMLEDPCASLTIRFQKSPSWLGNGKWSHLVQGVIKQGHELSAKDRHLLFSA